MNQPRNRYQFIVAWLLQVREMPRPIQLSHQRREITADRLPEDFGTAALILDVSGYAYGEILSFISEAGFEQTGSYPMSGWDTFDPDLTLPTELPHGILDEDDKT